MDFEHGWANPLARSVTRPVTFGSFTMVRSLASCVTCAWLVAANLVGCSAAPELAGEHASTSEANTFNDYEDAGERGGEGRPDSGSAPINATNDSGTQPLGTDYGDMTPKCFRRGDGSTPIAAIIRVDAYKGIRRGRNGYHELFSGTIVNTKWVHDSGIVDTDNVSVAMNVASPRDPEGLPNEIPLRPGDEVELKGSYISAAASRQSNANGPAAIIHFTHSPCGYANIGGHVYQ